MNEPHVFDQQGKERDWVWLEENFGAVSLERTEVPAGVTHVYRVVKLQDAEGPAVQIVNVTDADGQPLDGVQVVRSWPDAPPLPAWPSPTSMWRNQGVYGGTDGQGNIGFGMGRGDYYFPPGGGASALWVASEAGPADLMTGLGMLGGTNHRRVDVYYQLQPVDAPAPEPPQSVTPPQPEPEPEPPAEDQKPPAPKPESAPHSPPPASDEWWQELSDKLDRIIELLERRLE
jgi:hypothetical protein